MLKLNILKYNDSLLKNLNMNRYSYLLSIFGLAALLFAGCQSGQKKIEISKQEILTAEKEFASLCATEGIEKAFTTFADEEATILRGDRLVKGKVEIGKQYLNPKYKTATLKWWPDFVDVSASGDLGYTYGHYIWTSTDSSGKKVEHKGIFHTVWKKRDGKWKFVWD